MPPGAPRPSARPSERAAASPEAAKVAVKVPGAKALAAVLVRGVVILPAGAGVTLPAVAGAILRAGASFPVVNSPAGAPGRAGAKVGVRVRRCRPIAHNPAAAILPARARVNGP
jgi:hypothetical protein